MTWDLDRLGRSAADAVQPAPVAGATIGKYRIIRELAGGAAGIVYEAEDPGLRRRVALKVLREVHGASDVLRHRFAREAQAAAGLDHPNVLRVFDAGEDQGRMYLAMELIDGESLAGRLSRRPFELKPMLRTLVKAARGVAAAHERSIVHRDVKPANILVTRQGEPKVGDFGLARMLDNDTGLTKTGTPLGTPLYMAPEQVRGDQTSIGPATDVYALGAILYEILTGRAPHTGETATEIYGKILQTDPLPPRRLDGSISSELETICMKALEPEPADRYATAAEFADDLDRHLNGETILARPPGPLLSGWKWARRHRTASLAAALTTVFLVSIIALLVLQVRRSKRETEALVAMEKARPALDQAVRGLYRQDADLEALRRGVADARPFLARAIELDPARALPHYLMGRAWELEGYEDRAEGEWRKAIALEPSFGPALFQLGRLLAFRSFTSSLGYSDADRLRRKDLTGRMAAEAVAMLHSARQAGSGFDDRLQVEYATALGLQLERNLPDALRSCLDAIRRHGAAEGVEEFHWLHGWLTPGPERLEAYERALALCPHHLRTLYCRGIAYGETGRPREAVADYSAAIKVNPRLAGVWGNRADARLDLGDLDGAIFDCNEALKLEPANMGAIITRAIAKRRKGDLDGAIADYGVAIGIDRDYATPWFNRGNARFQKGEREEAFADFEKAIALAPGLATPRIERGRCRFVIGDKTGALEDFNRAIELDPGNPDGWYYRGMGRADQRKLAEAYADLTKALSLAPPDYPLRAEAKRIIDLIPESSRGY